MIIELIGYAGSLLIVFSMLMTSVIKLRVINGIGSIIFTAYALIIHSYPTAAMNFSLIIINFYNLAKLLKGKNEYSIVKADFSESFVRNFLELYAQDIKIFFPESLNSESFSCAYIICHKSNAVGIFLGDFEGENSVKIKLDYSIPAYRDCSVGKCMYGFLASQKISQISQDSPSTGHIHYLEKMGFKKQGETWIKEL